MTLSRKKLNIELYKKLYLIRASEEAIRGHYQENEMKTPMHMSIGAEAIAAGVCHALEDGEVLSSYRSHAVYLAKTGDTNGFFAELYGKSTGPARGKAGSMHLSSPEKGFLGASAVVASTIPVAVGAAYANKRLKKKKMVAVFFGDGAVDEGVFWESINLASLMRLPILFVCEDNGLAIHVPKNQRQGYDSLAKILSGFRCNVLESDTTDTEVIHALAKKAAGLYEKNGMPVFLLLRYYRHLEHVGINEDFDAGYRPKAEFEAWKKKDPVFLQRKKLARLGIKEGEVNLIEKGIDKKIAESISSAKRAKYPDKKELYQDIYV